MSFLCNKKVAKYVTKMSKYVIFAGYGMKLFPFKNDLTKKVSKKNNVSKGIIMYLSFWIFFFKKTPGYFKYIFKKFIFYFLNKKMAK